MKAAKAISFLFLLPWILQFTDTNWTWQADKRITQVQAYPRECFNPPNLEISRRGPWVVRRNPLSACDLICFHVPTFSRRGMLDSDLSNDDYGISCWCGNHSVENIWPSDVKWIQVPRGYMIQQNQSTLAFSWRTRILSICTRPTDNWFVDKSMIPQFS